jgi:MYXO-CTERM domain-containing protein
MKLARIRWHASAWFAVCAWLLWGAAAQAQVFVNVGTAPEARSQLATPEDGQGLIHYIGGYTGGNPVATHNIYNPVTNSWSTGAALPEAKRAACWATLADGRPMVMGGFSTGQLSSVHIYNSNNTWTTAPNLPQGHGWYCAATRGADGRVYVFGGEGAATALSIYNPGTNSWSAGAALPAGRLGHGAGLLSDGRILVFGGNGLATSHIYNPTNNTWVAGPTMPGAKQYFAFGAVSGRFVYATGGSTNYGNYSSPFFNNTFIYDAATNTWSPGPNDVVTRRETSGAVVAGRFYVLGGNAGVGADRTNVSRLDVIVNRPPVVDAGGPYTVGEGLTVALQAVGIDPDGDNVTYAWDLDNDGQFDDATGAQANFTGVDGPATATVRVQASDGQATAVDTATVTITNRPPTAQAISVTPAPIQESKAMTVALTGLVDPGNDPVTVAWDFGDGTTGTGASAAKTWADNGIYVVRAVATDDDGASVALSANVVVDDVPPDLDRIIGGTVLNEGTQSMWRSTLTKAAQDVVSWTIIWGDGSPNESGTVGAGVATAEINRPHAYQDEGTYMITFRAVDDDGSADTATFTVRVNNVAPTITALNVTPMTGPEGTNFGFAGVATDPGMDTLTYTWNFGDGTPVATGQSVMHTYGTRGTYTVTLTVTDGDGGSATRTAQVVVSDAPPVISVLRGDTEGDEGDEFAFTAAASDPGGLPLTYTWDFGDGSMPVSGVGLTNLTHTYRRSGAVTLRLTVSDGVGTATRTLTVTVNNVAPTLGEVTIPTEGDEGMALNFVAAASDPGDDTLTYTWDFGDGTPAGTGSPLLHTFADDGAYFVQVTVSDGDGGTDREVRGITIRNVSPRVDELTGDFTGVEGGTFDFQVSASDPGDDTLTYLWSFGDGSPTERGEGLTQVSHVYANGGTFTLSLTVSDEDGGAVTVTRTVTVGGQGPGIVRLEGDTEGDEGSPLAFSALAVEPGNDPITYRWDFGDGTPAVSAVDLTDVEHTYAEDGDYTLTLTVTDPDGMAQATLTVTVNNAPPVILDFVAPTTANEGQSISTIAIASDPAGRNDPLTYSWSFGDGADPVSGRSANHTYTNEGSYIITLTVTDDEGASTAQTQEIIVGNVAPSIAQFVGPNTANEGQEVVFSALAVDPGGDTLTYTWTFGDGSDPVSGEDLTSVRKTFGDNGAFMVRLRVSDGVAAVERTQMITIRNVSPTITALSGDTTGLERANFAFMGAASDPAGANDPLTWRWDFGDGSDPQVAGDLTAVSHVYQDAGAYTLTLTVTDGDGGSASRTLIVNVGNAAPVISRLEGDTEGDEAEALSFSAAASDAGGDALTYTWDFGDNSPRASGVDLTEVNHAFPDNGTYTVTLSVSDGAATVTRTLAVTIFNVAPEIRAATAPMAGVEGQSLAFSAVGSDVAGNNDPLTYTWSWGDDTPDFEGRNATHTFGDNSTYTVTLTVEDDDGGVVRRTFMVAVSNANPTLTGVTAPEMVNEGQDATFFAVASDVRADALTYTWAIEGGPTLQGAQVSYRWADDGAFTVTLTVADDDGGQTTRALTVQVNNVSPSITELTGDFTGSEGDTFNFAAQATDPGDDTLTYTWRFGDEPPGGNVPPLSGVDLTEVSHVYTDDGTYTLSLTVSDEDGGVIVLTRTVNVGTAAPSITALNGPRRGDEAQALAFSAQATDPTDQTLTWRWDFGDGTEPMSGEGLTEVTHTFADNGSYVVTLTVTDTDDLSATATLGVVINNLAPTISALTPGAFAENTPGMVTGAASDPAGDADPLTWTWSWGDGTEPAVGVGLTGASHTYAQDGTYTLTLTVSDGDGGSASRSVQITVTDRAPMIAAIMGDLVGDEGGTFSFMAQASDPAGDPLTYTWQVQGRDPVDTDNNNVFQTSFPDNGAFTLSVTVTDDEGQRASTQVQVQVNNVSPTIAQISGPREGVEGEALAWFADVTDPAGASDPLTYTWTFGDGSPAVMGVGRAGVEHTYRANGAYTLTLVVTDGDGGRAEQRVTVQINNGAPVITALNGPDRVTEGAEANFFVVANDPGGDALTYRWTLEGGPSPSGMNLTEVAYAWPDNGSFLVTVVVEDGQGGSATASRAVVVENANPIITELVGDFRGEEGQALSFRGVAQDPGDDTLTWTWDFGDGTRPQSGEGLTMVTHTYNDSQTWTLTVTVTDEDGGRAVVTRTINVGTAAPTLLAFDSPDQGDEGAALVFSAQASDPTDQTLTWRWDFGDGSEALSGEGLTEVTHTFADDGAYLVTVTVTDEDGLTAAAGEQVRVRNVAPIIGNLMVGAFGEAVPGTVSGQASDAAGDADPLTWSWSWGDGSEPSEGEGLTEATHTYRQSGTYTLRLTVSDGDGGVATRTAEVVVGDEPPLLQEILGPREGDEGQTLSYEATVTDPGGDPLRFAWQVNDGDLIETGNEGRLSYTFAEDGTYTVTLIVTDSEEQSVTQSFEVQISNLAPEISALSGRREGVEGELLSYFAAASDAGGDNDPLTWRWDFGDGTAAVEGADLTQIEHTFTDNGTYAVTLTVTDDEGAETVQFLSVEVQNAPPVITSIPSGFAVLGETYEYEVVATDAGDDVLTYALVEGPEGMAFDAQTLRWELPVSLLGQGPFVVLIRVSDDDGGRAEQRWEITTDFVDLDEDGVPDTCEEAFGLDPNDPNDGDLDPDMDGISNRDECLDGTNPNDFNGPTAPTLVAPELDARLATTTPDLVVGNATDPDGDALTYTFEVFSDEALTLQVAQVEGVTEAADQTTWTVEVELEENGAYWWRAAAQDGAVRGPWSEVGRFLIDATNEAPTVPNLVSPDGGADTLSPVLVIDPSTDPEGDGITYLYEVYAEAELETLLASGESEETSWTTDPALTEDGVYWWRAAARDDLGAQSDWAEALFFKLNSDNNLPEAPVITAPTEAEVVDLLPAAITWQQAVDADGDDLTYELEVASDEGFAAVVFTQQEIPMGDGAEVSLQVPGLEEDTGYWARVRANDGQGFGPHAVVGFFINAQNTAALPPVPVSPINGDSVAESGFEMVFENATDPDGEALTYTIEVFSDEGLTEKVATFDNIPSGDGQSAFMVTEALPGGKLYWVVFGTDARGLAGARSEIADFNVLVTVSGSTQGSGCACATSPAPARLPWAPLLALVGALGALWLRRR